jgi:hypothetical protein
MSPQEEVSFRSLYAKWPTERLARASTVEKNDYRPEAVALMLAELDTRGVSGEAASSMTSR